MVEGGVIYCVEEFTFLGAAFDYIFKKNYPYIVKSVFVDGSFAVYNPRDITKGNFMMPFERRKNFTTLKELRKKKLKELRKKKIEKINDNSL